MHCVHYVQISYIPFKKKPPLLSLALSKTQSHLHVYEDRQQIATGTGIGIVVHQQSIRIFTTVVELICYWLFLLQAFLKAPLPTQKAYYCIHYSLCASKVVLLTKACIFRRHTSETETTTSMQCLKVRYVCQSQHTVSIIG